ncbi:MAG: SusC/RagA family TonB-linked outer membrane protein, partial [Bacteroidales bacterium]|nr:SusC/RagA family TonB-linked outer membrane protein [Bacteroidales bacterium]
YEGKFTLKSLGKKAELFDAAGYIDYHKYLGNITDELLKSNGYNGQNTNWYDEAFENAWTMQHGITVQGGNDKGHFLASLNLVDDDGIVKGSKDTYKRLTGQINADYKLFKWFDISTNTSFEKWSTKSVSAGYGSTLNSVVSIDPLTPAYISDIKDTPVGMQDHYLSNPDLIPRDPSHNNDFYGTSKYLEEATGNPLFQRDKSDATSSGINIRGTIAANLKPVNGLVITSRFGYRIAQSSSHSYTAPYWLTAMAYSDQYSISANVNTNHYYQWENFANYMKDFGKNNINVMAGMSYIQTNSDNASISSNGTDILKGYDENFRYIDYLTSDATKTVGNAPGKTAQISYFGRLGYTYDNRYSVQANFRADAYDSSKLSKQARWGFFPSVSAGWTLSNENFWKDHVNTDIFNFVKFRGSWGRNGNVNVLSGYKYATTISLNSSMYQYNPSAGNGQPTYGSMTSGLANPDLKWETSEQFDFGIDARFINDRLTFGFDWYRKTTKDLLVEVSNLPEVGVEKSFINAGKVLNQGLEFELGWKDHVGDFSYGISANASTLKNEVLEVSSILNRIGGNGISGLNNKLQTAFESGYPIWYFRGFKYKGVDSQTGQAIYYDKDGKDTYTPTDNDKQYLGEGIPNFTYGITVNLAWKGLDLTVFGTGVAGNEIYNIMVSADRPKVNSLSNYWDNSWKKEGDSAKYPDMRKVSSSWDFFSSSAAIYNGSYFKIKQIQLGYTLPRQWTKKVLLNDVRVYASLDDFFVFTSYPGADPETASYNNGDSRGMDSGSYPTSKKAVFGISLTF